MVLWLNGGPGFSSLYGLLTQWGPRKISEAVGFEDNRADLSQSFNLLFLDNPIGAGWSRGAKAEYIVSSSEEAAEDMFEFLLAFKALDFNLNGRNFRANELHITGESYAGHYIPYLAKRIAVAKAAESTALKLRSVIIGNGWFDQLTQYEAVYDFVCKPDLVPDKAWLLDDDTCKQWEVDLHLGCTENILSCRAPGGFCSGVTLACMDCTPIHYWRVRQTHP